MKKIKNIMKRILYGEKCDSATYINFLRKKGVTIGDNCHFFSLPDVTVDISYPWLITIGNNVQITKGVIILAHDYSWSVLKHFCTEEYPEGGVVLGAGDKVKIGNNIFIGMNSIILKGTIIGDNSIIGAGSVVKGKLEGNGVYAGNPAQKIMDLRTFFDKRVRLQYQEAVTIVKEYYKRYRNLPDESVLREFIWLFRGTTENLPEYFDKVLALTGNYKESCTNLNKHQPMFNTFEDFIKSIDFEENYE